MTVKKLIEELQKVEDKSLDVRVRTLDREDIENFWCTSIEVSDTGSSGYGYFGEVVINGE